MMDSPIDVDLNHPVTIIMAFPLLGIAEERLRPANKRLQPVRTVQQHEFLLRVGRRLCFRQLRAELVQDHH